MTRSRVTALGLPSLAGAGLGCLVLEGCGRAPAFSILGSFFPAWIVCIAIGIVLTLLVRWFLRRRDLERELTPRTLVYPAMAAFFTCVLWLLFFR